MRPCRNRSSWSSSHGYINRLDFDLFFLSLLCMSWPDGSSIGFGIFGGEVRACGRFFFSPEALWGSVGVVRVVACWRENTGGKRVS
jgi:hypothetical protein